MKHVIFIATIFVMFPITLVTADDSSTEKDHQNLVKELMRKIEALEEIVEGTAQPINLGRTSLARVNASSVNGSRALNNKFYGIRNAFDDGKNWHNNLNYTYWLSGGDPRPWVTIQFESPVSLTSVTVEGAPAFSTTLFFGKGGEEHTARPKNSFPSASQFMA